MGIQEAGEGILDLFSGRRSPGARRAALLLGSVLLANRPKLPEIVIDEADDGAL